MTQVKQSFGENCLQKKGFLSSPREKVIVGSKCRKHPQRYFVFMLLEHLQTKHQVTVKLHHAIKNSSWKLHLHFTRHTSGGIHWWLAFRMKADHSLWNKCVWSARAIHRTLPGVIRKALHSLWRTCFKSVCPTTLQMRSSAFCMKPKAQRTPSLTVSGHYWRSSQNAKKFYNLGLTKTELFSVLSMKK